MYEKGCWESRDSSVDIVLRPQAGLPRNCGSISCRRNRFFSSPGVETGSVATHSPIQWDKRTPSQELKRPLCEVDHSCPYTTGLKSAWALFPFLNKHFWRGEGERSNNSTSVCSSPLTITSTRLLACYCLETKQLKSGLFIRKCGNNLKMCYEIIDIWLFLNKIIR